MHQYGLFTWLKSQLLACNPTLTDAGVNFNDMDSNGDNVCGVYIKGDTPKVRRLSDMAYCNQVARVEIMQVCALDNNSLMTAQQALSDFADYVVTQAAVTYELDGSKVGIDPTGKVVYAQGMDALSPAYLDIVRVDALSSVLYIGKNTQGKPQVSLNLRIAYQVGGED